MTQKWRKLKVKILRAFQVINQDDAAVISSTYNEVNEAGEITKRNEKNSFYAVDEELQIHIDAIRTYLFNRLN